MIHFCTYFDINYIHKGIALYHSLVKTGQPFILWILCFDEATYNALEILRLPNVKLISEKDFEQDDKALLSAKASRSRVEYYWTCTPSLPLYIFRQNPSINILVYLDADMFFFSSPTAIIDELGEGSILIVPHDYAKEYEEHSASGIYNVGIMAFRRDTNGTNCLKWWRERCIEWCYWKHENGKIGDQAYLNDWPDRFQNVVVCNNAGINAAPWNVAKYGLKINEQGICIIGTSPLVCFHFHACRICNSRLAFIAGFKTNIPTSCLSIIYRPYLQCLCRVEAMLSSYGMSLEIPKSGIPWRYIFGQIIRGKPLRHFLFMSRTENICEINYLAPSKIGSHR